MKRLVAIILSVVFLLNCASTIPHYRYQIYEKENLVTINERVGDAIDAAEAKQYGLFKDITGFTEARFFAIEDGGYAVEIDVDGKKLAAINCDRDAIVILCDYINGYDEILADRATFTRKWRILDYDTLGIPITENEVQFTKKQSRGRAIKGCLSCLGGSVLFGLLVFLAVVSGSSSGTDIGVPLAAAAGLGMAAITVVAGLVASITIYKTTYKDNPDEVMAMIKEGRKPKPYGIRAAAKAPVSK